MSKNLLIVTCDTRCKSRREYQYQLSLSISNINDERQRDKRNLPNRTNFYNETLRHNQLIQVTVENDVKIKSQQPLQGVNTILKESERRKPRERITVDAAKECQGYKKIPGVTSDTVRQSERKKKLTEKQTLVLKVLKDNWKDECFQNEQTVKLK